MNFEEIEKLIKMLENSSLSYLEIEENGTRICLDKNGGVRSEAVSNNAQPVESKATEKEMEAPSGKEITAPLVGTFHTGPYQGAKPFVAVGDRVKKGQKLCIVEAMKVMNEITSPYDGVIKEICVKENDVVEFGKKLFVIGD